MNNSEAQVLKAASLYYLNGLTQDQIAKQFGLSRPTIIRMLKRALDAGYVEIKLTRKLPHNIELENLIYAKYSIYGINQLVVVDSDNEDPKKACAKATAEYLKKHLKSKHILGVGWSSTLSYLNDYMSKGKYSPERIVQLGGYLGGLGKSSAQHISIGLGSILEVPVETLPVPILLKNKELRDALLSDASVAQTMDWVSKCNMGIVGIGVTTRQSALVKHRYISDEEMAEVHTNGAVGEVLSHYFTAHGVELDTPWKNRMVTVDVKVMKNINNLIGVAAGAEKANSVKSVLRCGVLNTLIVDVPLAEAILK
ncbi:lsr operon transcriptional repressor [Glaciecola punicea ACAM 611]|jgi:DNA-binding transcriptional regulator LsrR (DeoR family)|uniref:Lsr operon transcriptional repressor n=1 Tax=Glaciecola punicea ACAM 611 TaxID=1121923 RepID=H5T871_9ALTE|nr:sugar-binding domain-containing protein [Glaciecola punicea]OFA29930.1 hypothetical protein BAE46_12950 [Glaciecola punicea]GAB54512.1 lsr operon transcriptional repressor [Glaciecola punicea ACAM 611]